MDPIRFKLAIDQYYQAHQIDGIGTLAEKTLHGVVKNYYSNHLENQEVRVDNFFVDIKTENEIIEIQTKQFNKLIPKLKCLLDRFPVRIVYPNFHHKTIYWVDPMTGEQTTGRVSPRRGSIYDVFYELYRIKFLLSHPNLKLSILLIDIDEIRRLDGWSDDRKRGSHCVDRIPINLVEEVNIDKLTDYLKLVPFDNSFKFTSRDYAKMTKLTLRKSQIALNVLSSIGVIEKIGKVGRLNLYQAC